MNSNSTILGVETNKRARIDTIDFNPQRHERYVQPPRDKPKQKPYRESFRQALSDYKEEYDLSNSDLGFELGGVGATQVSKYLNKKPEGDVASLERRIADVIMAAPLRRAYADELFETSASRAVEARLELIRKTNDVGLIHGPAGIGKSCGIDLYAAKYPTCILIRLARWSATALGVEKALYEEVENRDKPRGESRAPWLVERFKGSNRLIIVDNAQRLSKGGLEWLFDFHDETNCPIGLAGNPEVLDKIKSNDQLFSRVGNAKEVSLKRAGEASMQMLQNICPEHAEQLEGLASQIAKNKGHLRALKKHLLLLPELMDVAKGDPVVAFRMAHTQLVNTTDLSGID